MHLMQELHEILRRAGPGHMLPTAYDTAWLTRLGELGEPIGELALEWLRANQLPDGSWGASELLYYHDRVICTLAAINALARRGRTQDRERLRRAESTLASHMKQLDLDPTGETIGFEMIVPILLAGAKALGGLWDPETDVLPHLTQMRAAKLAALPTGMVNRYVTVAFSCEMAGPDGQELLDEDSLQEPDGSISHSPSATAYFALHVRRGDPAALKYLRRVAPGGMAPNVSPFNVFERSWVLWNLALTDPTDPEILALCEPHLDFLENAWTPGVGICWAAGQKPEDADDTAVTYKALTSLGRSVDVEAILRYELEDHFYCFPLESNPSTSAHIHILNALRLGGFEVHHPTIQKIIRFLQKAKGQRRFWTDKWHVSPYYATAHAIIACANYHPTLVEDAVEWVVNSQNDDGSWGFYMPTAEETAYCLQALTIWKRYEGQVEDKILKQGALWLKDHAESPYPPLWIGKCLYSPVLVVRSAILSSLVLIG